MIVPTGFTTLDHHAKGFPRPGITQMWAPLGTGFSEVAVQVLKTAIDHGHRVLFLDYVMALSSEALAKHGLRFTDDALIYCSPGTVLDTEAFIEQHLSDPDGPRIVLMYHPDYVAHTPGTPQFALWTDALPRIQARVMTANACVVGFFSEPRFNDEPPNGTWRHHASMRIRWMPDPSTGLWKVHMRKSRDIVPERPFSI